MQVIREDLNPCTVKLSITCDSEQVKAGYERAFKQLTKKIKLPGFRPGHAPKAMLEGLVPLQDLNEAAAQEIVRATLEGAIKDQAIEPDATTRQQVELRSLDRDANTCEYAVKVPLPPKVELGDYKALPLEKPKVEVTDEEVDHLIEDLRKRGQSRETVTDRGVEEGDVAVIRMEAEGEEGQKNFMTIAGQTFAQLDVALLGMKVEEMKSLELSFPDDFQEKAWAGTTKSVKVTLNSISAIRLPAVDDAFAKSFAAENVEDLRKHVRNGILNSKEMSLRQMIHEQLLEKLMERSQVAVSDNMWEALAQRRLQETADEQREQGRSFEEYASANGMTAEQLIDAWHQRAKLEVERALLIQSVFTKEQMQITNAELNQEVMFMAQEYGMEPEALVNLLKTNNALDELQFRTLARKVGDYLLSQAEVTEVDMPTAPAIEDASSEAPAEEPKKETKKRAKKEPKSEEPVAEEAAATE